YHEGAPAQQVEVVQPSAHRPALRAATNSGILGPLVQRLLDAEVPLEMDSALFHESMTVDGVVLTVTNGRTAADLRASHSADVVLLDLAKDYASTTLLGATASPGAVDALPALAAALNAVGIGLVRLDDVAGLVVMRTVACLANEAADVMAWS